MRFQKYIWSPLETDWLKNNKHLPLNQLTIILAKSRYAITKKIKELNGDAPAKTKTKKKPGNHSKMGKRKDCDGLYMRSCWESNLFRYLKTVKEVKKIEYEPVDFTFWQFGIKKGTISYTPDFKVWLSDGTYRWIEVKGGWLKPQDKTKLRRFKKYYPDEFKLLQAVTPSPKSKTTAFFLEMEIPIYCFYNELKKLYKDVIKNWE